MKLIDRVRKPKNELSDHITVRINNCLSAMGITTVEQLKQADDVALLKYPNFGKRGLQECLSFLERYIEEQELKE